MRVIFFSKKQNLTMDMMEGGQEKTVCVEGKFRVTSFNAYFNSVYKPLIGSFGFSTGCISTHGAGTKTLDF